MAHKGSTVWASALALVPAVMRPSSQWWWRRWAACTLAHPHSWPLSWPPWTGDWHWRCGLPGVGPLLQGLAFKAPALPSLISVTRSRVKTQP